ncbi:MAG: PAS domain S-box protein [Nostoc sp.]|uniref:PAS domain S-box protein n=1 Tax=Nostoc sp. TaxID=1180 RepID=UPI002FFC2604
MFINPTIVGNVMFLPHSFLPRQALENTIAPPIIVAPDVLVTDAIALLNSSSILPTSCNDAGMAAIDSATTNCTDCLAVVIENQLVGLFSERAVTRLVASGRSLAGVTLAEVIEPPAIALRQSELTTPEIALNLLRHHHIQHLPILDDNGQLLGLLTYESLCRLLQPGESGQPDEPSIIALQLQTERSQLLMAVSTRIRASLSLAEILDATVSEVRQFLGCDRVSIYKFWENGQFQVVAESLAAGQRSFVSEAIYDPCFASDWAEQYGKGRVQVVSDIYTAEMTPCHVELLERLQIRAKVLVPAIVNNQFWGLVSASESAVPRDWQPAEVTFLEQLAIQVAIAIQHSETITRFRQQRQELTALLDRTPDVIFRLDRDLRYLYLNASIEVELGYAPESLIGQPLLAATFAPEHFAEWQTITQQVVATGEEATIEHQLCIHSRSIWFQTRVVPEYNLDGSITSFLCVARNVTDKKQAQARQVAYINILLEWQNRHHAAQLATKQVLYEWDTTADHVTWGINADQVFGYSASEMPQTSADWFASIHPEDEERVQTAAAEYFEHQGNLYLQYRWRHQAGHYIWIEAQAQFFADANGNLTQIIGYVTDISERKRLEAERTQLETDLRESEAQLRQIFDNSQDVFFLRSLDGEQMIYTSPAWENLYQTPLQQTYDNPQAWLDFIHPEDCDRVITFNQQAGQREKVDSLGYRIVRPDGSIRWLWNRTFPIRNETGEIYRLAGVNIDITEQKQLELELNAVKERYQLAIRGIGEGVWDWDIASNRVIASDRYWEILGYLPPAENAPKFAYEVLQEQIHPDDRDLMQAALRRHLEDHLPYEVEFRRRKQSGEYIWCRSRGEAIRDQTGKPIRMVGAIADITEQKAMATALEASEQTLRQVVNTVPGVVYNCCRCADGTKRFRFISQGIIKLCEHTPEVILNDAQVLWNAIVPEDGERVRSLIDQSAAMLTPWTAEFRLISASGGLKWVSGHSLPSRQADGKVYWLIGLAIAETDIAGNVTGYIGTMTDITDRKSSEQALQESEQRYRDLAEAMPQMVWLADVTGAVHYFNQRWYDYTGQSQAEATGLGGAAAIHADERDRTIQKWVQSITTGKLFQIEYRVRHHQGLYHWFLARGVPIKNLAGKITGWVNIITGIDDFKRAELARKESEARFRAVFEQAAVGIVEMDVAGRCLRANRRICDQLGYTEAEMLEQSFESLTPRPDDFKLYLGYWQQLLANKIDSFALKKCILHKNGEFLWCNVTVAPVRDANGTINYCISLIQDIQDRKQAELALQASEAKLNDVLNSAGASIGHFRYYANGVWETDYHSRGCERVFGYRPDEFLAKVWLSRIFPEDLAVIHEPMLAAIKAEIETTFEYRFHHPDGSTRWILDTLTSRWNESDRCWFVTAIGTDDSDRKHAELALQQLNQELEARVARRTAALSESETRYRALFEQAAVGMSQCHLSGRYIEVNQRFCDLTGYTQSELVDMSWEDLIHLEYLELTRREVAHLHRGELASITVEIRYIRKDRRLQWVNLTVSMLYNAAGTIIGNLTVVEDISDRKQIERQLQNSEKRLKEIISKTVDGILILNPQGQILFSNPAADQIFNYQKPYYQGRDLGIPITLQKIFELEIPHPTTGVTTVEIRVEEITWQDNKAFLAAIRDISHRKQAEIALQASELSYRTLAENLPGIVYKLYPDQDNTFVFFNDRLTTLFQLDPIDIVNQGNLCPVNSLIVPEDRDRVIEVIQAAIANQQPFQVEYCIHIPATPEKRYLLEQGSTVTDDTGQALHIVGIIFDVTEIKQTEEKLRKINERLTIANAELARATRLKDEFLANMSHELRTPLNSILGLSEVLQERTYGDLTEQQYHTLTTIQTNGQHLLELINDILDLAKIESGKLYLQMTTVSAQQLCRSTIPFIQQQAFKKQISFTLEPSPDLADIELDERLIRQVLINLLTNAVKFTPNGGAVILKLQGNAAEQTFSFSVIDTGIGIDPENIDKLFQPFVQIDSSLSRRYAGTGLGLALVRRIIELHKGSVTVSSTVGQGSQFTVVLPWKQVTPNSDKALDDTVAVDQIAASRFLPVETRNTAEKPVVLLVEDNLDNIETLKAYLELKGFRIMVAHNGLQAIHLTQMHSFNLILMDIQMPDMNGLEAIRQIRAQEQDKRTPILVVTALAMSGDKEKCLASGANDYLTKPFSPFHLINLMKKYL